MNAAGIGSAAVAWAEFMAGGHTCGNQRGDFPDWHRGRPRFAVWAIDLAAEAALRDRIATVQTALSGLLLPGYRRQPHLTLHVCGFPEGCPAASAADAMDAMDAAPSASPLPDMYSQHNVKQQLAALRAAAVRPFTLRIGAVSSFATAPFLAVDGALDSLTALRRALAVHEELCRPAAYVPHVTVGLYAGTHPAAEVARRCDRLEPAAPVKVTVRRISLMSYRSRLIAGPLRPCCHVDLATGAVEFAGGGKTRLA